MAGLRAGGGGWKVSEKKERGGESTVEKKKISIKRNKTKTKNYSPSSPARARPTIPAPTMATSNVASSSSRCEEVREEGEEEEKGRRRQEEAPATLANRSSPLFSSPLKKNAAARRDAGFLEADEVKEATAADENSLL